MAKSSFILLLLIQCLSYLTISQGYDFFYFVQQWSPSYCNRKTPCCYPTSGKPATNFTINGLWPHSLGSYTSPTDCNGTPYDETKIADLFSRLQVSWPTVACPKNNGTKFWKSEWNKHGTCSESVLDQHAYFKAALNLKDKIDIHKILEKAGIHPGEGKIYSVDDIKAAIKAGSGYTAQIECNGDKSKNSQLHKVFLCADHSGKELIECPLILPRKCNETIRFPTFPNK